MNKITIFHENCSPEAAFPVASIAASKYIKTGETGPIKRGDYYSTVWENKEGLLISIEKYKDDK